ncbi:hypothetical protein OIU76_012559 [Salix suchowensis]|nr:hypothetical protein OIU76_012559 [Salix suchowensis]
MYNSVSFDEKLLIISGNIPPKLFLLIPKYFKLVQFARLWRKMRSPSSPIPSSLESIARTFRLGRFGKGGTFPVKLFFPRSIWERVEALEIVTGIGPLNLLA